MSDDIGSIQEGSDGEYSIDEDDQLQPEDSLVDRGVDDVLDEGYAPPDREPLQPIGLTAREQLEGETLDQQLAEEEPDVGAESPDDLLDEADDLRPRDRTGEVDESFDEEWSGDDQVGDDRAGRLVGDTAIDGEPTDTLDAEDVGIDGAAASAEEAAVHTIDDDPDGDLDDLDED